MTEKFTVEIEWSTGDQAFACALQRDGKPWLLNGALVGMGTTLGQAVTELAGAIRYLVIHGDNYLTEGPLAFPDRAWLASLIDPLALDDDMFSALRAAGEPTS